MMFYRGVLYFQVMFYIYKICGLKIKNVNINIYMYLNSITYINNINYVFTQSWTQRHKIYLCYRKSIKKTQDI